MSLYFWNSHDYFKKLPSIRHINLRGKRRWDGGIEYKSTDLTGENQRTIFTMPSFARHGRWGNMVFQYIFIRILAANNNGEVELFRTGDRVSERMLLYKDTIDIPTVQTKTNTIILDNYRLLNDPLTYIPASLWRALYVSMVRKQECYILKNADETINKPLPFDYKDSIEVEGLFLVNTEVYKPHKQLILNTLFQPNDEFESHIQTCVQNLGENKTIVGIHIRRGDFVFNPLDQPFQFPIPIKYIINWLGSNVSLIKEPVIFVCSDDPNAYKEIERAGFEVFSIQKLLPEGETLYKFEQLEWEILRRCDVLLTSNSTFSFSAAWLNHKNPKCYRFSLENKLFEDFDPWSSEPVQLCAFSPTARSYLSSRYSLVKNMVSSRSALVRLLKDTRRLVRWKSSKARSLYYKHGFSSPFLGDLFNFVELFKIPDNTDYLDHNHIEQH
jgi:hypothetical protein